MYILDIVYLFILRCIEMQMSYLKYFFAMLNKCIFLLAYIQFLQCKTTIKCEISLQLFGFSLCFCAVIKCLTSMLSFGFEHCWLTFP